jgi:hypothetical protein
MTDALRPRAGRLPLARPASRVEETTVRSREQVAGETRRPHHVGVLLGLSAGAYAITLAGIAGLQSATDQATIAAREPTQVAAEALAAEHDRLEAELAAARRSMTSTGEGYDATVALMTDLQARLDALAAAVGDLEGQTLALPTRLSLPSAPRVPAAASRPATQATTGASGG